MQIECRPDKRRLRDHNDRISRVAPREVRCDGAGDDFGASRRRNPRLSESREAIVHEPSRASSRDPFRPCRPEWSTRRDEVDALHAQPGTFEQPQPVPSMVKGREPFGFSASARYSQRSASAGSVEAARLAGSRHAATATTARTIDAAINDAMSSGAMPNRTPCMKRVSTAAPSRHTRRRRRRLRRGAGAQRERSPAQPL
jgi:hypothetical protein